MAWAYNEIDVMVSNMENQLISPASDTSFVSLSNYGIVRSRPVIVPSTMNANQITVPGMDGTLYSSIKQRSNASLEFELLIVNAWPFANSGLTLLERLYTATTRCRDAKRVMYKEPGRDNTFYLEVRKVDITESDVDQDAALLKIKMEVYPFKFDFIGNNHIDIARNHSERFEDSVKYSPCNPIYAIKTGDTALHSFDIYYIDEKDAIVERKTMEVRTDDKTKNEMIYIDTGKLLAYYLLTGSGQAGLKSKPAGRYLNGVIEDFRFKHIPGCTLFVISGVPELHVYTREGMII